MVGRAKSFGSDQDRRRARSVREGGLLVSGAEALRRRQDCHDGQGERGWDQSWPDRSRQGRLEPATSGEAPVAGPLLVGRRLLLARLARAMSGGRAGHGCRRNPTRPCCIQLRRDIARKAAISRNQGLGEEHEQDEPGRRQVGRPLALPRAHTPTPSRHDLEPRHGKIVRARGQSSRWSKSRPFDLRAKVPRPSSSNQPGPWRACNTGSAPLSRAVDRRKRDMESIRAFLYA